MNLKYARLSVHATWDHHHVVGRLACPSDPKWYAGWSLVLLAGTPIPNRSKGRDQTKSDPTGSPGWGLGRGLITLCRIEKNYYRNQNQSEFTTVHGIPILRTSKGDENWFEKSESSRNRG